MNTDETHRFQEIPPVVTKKKGKEKKERKFHMKPAPIETVTEFDIAEYIKNLPCELSIGQASTNIPKYQKAMLNSVRRRREANSAFAANNDSQATAA